MYSNVMYRLLLSVSKFRLLLSVQVQNFIGNSLYNNSAVEKQVLNLYDQLYQSCVLKNNSMFDPSPAHHDQETGEDFLYELPAIIMDNLETVMSVSTA